MVTGDVTDPDAVVKAARGSDAAIHCAALLGGASQNLADFEAVNIGGTKNVLDAAEVVDMGRVVAVSTGTFFDTAGGLDREDAPVTKKPSQDPYTITKMAAFLDAMARAEQGRDVVSADPGAIFGPSPVVSNALGITSFNRVLLSAAAGADRAVSQVPSQLGVRRGHRPRLHPGAGQGGGGGALHARRPARRRGEHRQRLQPRVPDGRDSTMRSSTSLPSDDPELAKVFGPTLVAIAEKAACQTPQRKCSRTPRPTSASATAPSPLTRGWTGPCGGSERSGSCTPPESAARQVHASRRTMSQPPISSAAAA